MHSFIQETWILGSLIGKDLFYTLRSRGRWKWYPCPQGTQVWKNTEERQRGRQAVCVWGRGGVRSRAVVRSLLSVLGPVRDPHDMSQMRVGVLDWGGLSTLDPGFQIGFISHINSNWLIPTAWTTVERDFWDPMPDGWEQGKDTGRDRKGTLTSWPGL